MALDWRGISRPPKTPKGLQPISRNVWKNELCMMTNLHSEWETCLQGTKASLLKVPPSSPGGISRVMLDLQKKDIIVSTCSPCNSSVWPVKKPNRKWWLTMDYGKLNANTVPLTAAVPNIAELIDLIQETHPSLATTTTKNLYFMIPFQESHWNCFTSTWEEMQ